MSKRAKRFWTLCAMLGVAFGSVAAVQSAATAMAARSGRQSGLPAKCPGGVVDIGRGVDVIEAWRGYKGDDGQSHLKRVTIPGSKGAYYGGKVHVTIFDLGAPTGASLVYGEPNMDIPIHPVPYKETFIILSGSSDVQTPDGQVVHLKAGSIVMSEDLGTPGRRGRSGPCGYVALSLAYKSPR